MATKQNTILDATADLSGITVCHKDEDIDVYGGRGTNQANLRNTDVGKYGWLGNPYRINKQQGRAEVIAKYVPAFYSRMAEDHEFREAVKQLDGKRVGCWCRHSHEDGPACHLDVIDQFLKGGRLYVREYLTDELGVMIDGTTVVSLR